MLFAYSAIGEAVPTRRVMTKSRGQRLRREIPSKTDQLLVGPGVMSLAVTNWDEEHVEGPAGMFWALSQVDETLMFLRGVECWEQRRASEL